jgi:hypothetical protein
MINQKNLHQLLAALLLTGSLSCSTDSEPNEPKLPVRLQNNYSTEVGNYSAAANLLGKRPVLILDDIPTEPGRAAIAGGCMQPLPAEFELGYAICSEGKEC